MPIHVPCQTEHPEHFRVLYVLLSFMASPSAGPYPAVANRPSFVAVGDGLTESAFSSEHMGWGLLLQQKYVRKVSSTPKTQN
jgi:hypothetical protein